jgi:hypothetical protein
MAKKQTATAAETSVVEIPAGLTGKYGDFTIDFAGATPATLAYCLMNGFHQSMVDAAAFSKEEKEGKTEDEVATMALAKRQSRFDNIVAGTVGARVGGPRVRGIDKLMHDVAHEKLIAIAVAKGKALPKGKGSAEKIATLIGMYLSDATRYDAVKAEAQRRMDSSSDAGDFDLGEVA